MQSAIIYSTSCLSVTTLKEKIVPTPGPQGGYWDEAGKERSETGCEFISTAQPKEGLAHPKRHFWQVRGQEQRFTLVKLAPAFPVK